MAKEQRDRLSFAILQHIQEALSNPQIPEDAKESLSVGYQCLSEGFGLKVDDPQQALRFKVDKSLADIFNDVYPPLTKEVSKDDEARAVEIKDKGNELMKQNKYEEAIEKYTEAIELAPNAIFYCNRAAAYSKVSQHQDAVKDSKAALQIDPNYGKAYARMGFAYLSLNQLPEAQSSYEKAISLDPNNKSYQDNLDAVKERISTAPSAGAGPPPIPGMAGMDFNQILNNPMFMQMTQQLMSDPAMQNRFAQMAESFLGGMGGGGGGQAPGQMPDFSAMMNDPALRQVAENMEQQNPDLLNNLRSMFTPPGNGSGANNPADPDQNPPPNSS